MASYRIERLNCPVVRLQFVRILVMPFVYGEMYAHLAEDLRNLGMEAVMFSLSDCAILMRR